MKTGRKRIGKHKTYRISDSDYRAFKEWCHSKGFTVNEVIRALIKRTAQTTVRGLIFEDPEFEKLAKELLFQKIREEFKVKEMKER